MNRKLLEIKKGIINQTIIQIRKFLVGSQISYLILNLKF